MSVGRLGRRGTMLLLVVAAVGSVTPEASAQQFNSDNYLAMPHGTATFVITYGQSYAAILNSFALFPSWEFFAGATLNRSPDDGSATDSFSTSLYVKKMFYENAEKNGGFAVMGGSGGFPGYLAKGELVGSFRTYWIAAPLWVPLFHGGFCGTSCREPSSSSTTAKKKTASAFTYSTRLALYGVVPQSAIVGEVFGAEGSAGSTPEYKAGIRWEPGSSVVVAATYGSARDGSEGAGLEAGVVVFSPSFLCLGGRK